MALHLAKRDTSPLQGNDLDSNATPLPVKESPAALPLSATGPLFTPADMKRALDVLDVCLQNYAWHPGENKIKVDTVFRAMHPHGPTGMLIEALLRRLIAEQVFQLGSHTIPAGNRRDPATGLWILRFNPETTPYLVTTKERWFTYLARQGQAEDRAFQVNTICSNKDGATADLNQEERTYRNQDSEKSPAASALLSNGSPLSTEGAHAFANFSKTQRHLLLSLQGRLPVPIADVKKVVYGNKSTKTKTIEQLVTRTNQSLTAKNTGLEIKRKANTLQLLPLG